MKKSKGFFKVTIYTNANEFGYGKVSQTERKRNNIMTNSKLDIFGTRGLMSMSTRAKTDTYMSTLKM